ncbi:MAG: CvpA family protein [Epsilonproteobacteria bacterium]|nr:colicin V synthesis protein [Campylobacterota bacterium]NPA56620.1 CvpA family protein [Campylobacterota bacterium]
METLSTFDLVVGAIIFFLGLKGLVDGFIKEFFGLAGIIGGIYYGSRYAEEVGRWISDNIFYIKNEAALSFVGFVVTLAGVWIAMVIVASLITSLTHASGMGTLNRLLGVLFGWAKIFLIFSVLIYAASHIGFTQSLIQKYTKNSRLYPLMLEAGGYIIHLKPEDFRLRRSETNSTASRSGGERSSMEQRAQEIDENIGKGVGH